MALDDLLEKFMRHYAAFRENLKTYDKGQRAYLLFGKTGVGKSTFSARLMSDMSASEFFDEIPKRNRPKATKLKKGQRPQPEAVVQEQKRTEIEGFTIGDGVRPTTVVPKPFFVEGWQVFDMPGVEDHDDDLREIIDILYKCLLNEIARSGQQFTLLVVVRAHMLQNIQSSPLVSEYHRRFEKLFGDNYRSMMSRMAFVVTGFDIDSINDFEMEKNLSEASEAALSIGATMQAMFLNRVKGHYILPSYEDESRQDILDQLRDCLKDVDGAEVNMNLEEFDEKGKMLDMQCRDFLKDVQLNVARMFQVREREGTARLHAHKEELAKVLKLRDECQENEAAIEALVRHQSGQKKHLARLNTQLKAETNHVNDLTTTYDHMKSALDEFEKNFVESAVDVYDIRMYVSSTVGSRGSKWQTVILPEGPSAAGEEVQWVAVCYGQGDAIFKAAYKEESIAKRCEAMLSTNHDGILYSSKVKQTPDFYRGVAGGGRGETIHQFTAREQQFHLFRISRMPMSSSIVRPQVVDSVQSSVPALKRKLQAAKARAAELEKEVAAVRNEIAHGTDQYREMIAAVKEKAASIESGVSTLQASIQTSEKWVLNSDSGNERTAQSLGRVRKVSSILATNNIATLIDQEISQVDAAIKEFKDYNKDLLSKVKAVYTEAGGCTFEPAVYEDDEI